MLRTVIFTPLDKSCPTYLQEVTELYSTGHTKVKTKWRKEVVSKDFEATETQERVLDLILRSNP